MKLFINEKIFSIKEKFDVYDESGSPVYHVESDFFTIGKKTHIRNMNDEEVVYIEEELFHFFPRFNFYQNSIITCQIKKEFALLHEKYTIGEKDWHIEGDLFSLNFDIVDSSDFILAKVNKKLISWGDKFCIDILSNNDVELLLACVIVIAIMHNRSEQAASNN